MSERLPLAVSVGCPAGIGPEVAVAACASFDEPVILVGDETQLRALAARTGHSLDRHRIVSAGPVLADADRVPGTPTRPGGAAQLAWIDAATDLVTSGQARALVTGPVSKHAIATSGAPGATDFTGHTEHLQRRLGADEVVMAFWSEGLSTALATTHLALRAVPDAVTPAAVGRATYWLAWLLDRLGHRPPRVVVAALNPHAGEGGLLGTEEMTALVPGIALARERMAATGLVAHLTGPTGAESAYRLAHAGEHDGVVAVYHDQATIAMKLLGFGEAVNVSLGLPIVRTSVDHGTGYPIAGQGRADARGMVEALRLAHRLTSLGEVTDDVGGRGTSRQPRPTARQRCQGPTWVVARGGHESLNFQALSSMARRLLHQGLSRFTPDASLPYLPCLAWLTRRRSRHSGVLAPCSAPAAPSPQGQNLR